MGDMEWPVDHDRGYAALADHASRIAGMICGGVGRPPQTASTRYVLEESRRLLDAWHPEGHPRPRSAAADTLDAIAAAWPSLCEGAVTGEEVLARQDGLWQRLMSEWPMGRYAQMSADALAAHDGPVGTVVELGAGVGVTTRLIRDSVAMRGGRLLATDLHYGASQAVDFDCPLLAQLPPADVVVATNALHCAADPVATLGWIRELLNPDGVLILGEGAPFPEPGVPWALNLLFGVCQGWFDRGGFRSPEFWTQAMSSAGFGRVSRHRWPSDRFEFGGVLVAS
ncbi:class I SAM-dependent methyltransferase [Kitasatospora sp. NBC_01560]|uniref:class I SAM-dependent methyltransferase n=1 Tax=Kitasatospora sp. NBC_01560 TaxID=2975965 RepID=UPI00386F666A